MNNYNKVIAALGLKMNQEFKIVGYSNIYKFTDEGLMFLAPNGMWLNEFDDVAMDILMGKLEILAKKILLTEQEEQWLKNLLLIPFMQSFMTIKKLPINDYVFESALKANYKGNINQICALGLMFDAKDKPKIGIPIAYFDADEYFTGLELNKDYSLEELGLISKNLS